ncbi:unnamed protein product, partial [Owenia fusiformis]
RQIHATSAKNPCLSRFDESLFNIYIFFIPMTAAMQIMDVVDPHFAVPVLGVVVCALLVLAFGFKSPVEPPSFDFVDEKKSRSKSKKTKQKTPSNGHIVQESSESVAKQPKQSPRTKQDAKDAKLSKVKKAAPGKSSRPEDVEPAKANETTEDAGEWTTHISKKRKKVLKENDVVVKVAEKAESPRAQTKEKSLSPEETPEAPAAPEQAPQEQRVKKEKGTPKKPKKEAVKETPVVPAAPELSQEATKPKTEEKAAPVVDAKSSKKASPKKSKKGAKVSEEAVQKVDGEVQIAPTEAKATDKPAQSPKKKANAQKSQSPEKEVSKSIVEADLKKVEAPITKAVESAPHEGAKTATSEAGKESSEPQVPVTFDELGDWQDAKPQKKKRKPRRDN